MSKSETLVPWWAKPLQEKQYQHFLDCIDEYFLSKRAKYVLVDDSIELAEGEDGGFGKAVFGLSNLAQICAANPTIIFSEIIRSHFEGILRANESVKEFKSVAQSFDAIKQYLAVRIYDENFVNENKTIPLVYRELSESLFEVLVFDLPDVIQPVTVEDTENWLEDSENLFAIGIQHVIDQYSFPMIEHDLDGIKLIEINTNHFFAAAIFYVIDSYPDLNGERGLLISFPTRSTALIHLIEKVDSLIFSARMTEITRLIYGDGPGSLSNKVFYCRDKKLVDVTASMIEIDGEPSMMLSTTLAELMGEITEA
jgi:hypothetical protein